MKIKFENVGRNKSCWTAEYHGELVYDFMYKQVKKYLRSNVIDFEMNDDKGTIFAGCHAVGSFKILEEKESDFCPNCGAKMDDTIS